MLVILKRIVAVVFLLSIISIINPSIVYTCRIMGKLEHIPAALTVLSVYFRIYLVVYVVCCASVCSQHVVGGFTNTPCGGVSPFKMSHKRSKVVCQRNGIY